jgi:tetratricopeptide (TPR) repeat protein
MPQGPLHFSCVFGKFCVDSGPPPMRSYSLDEIRRTFTSSTDFNEIFDVFQSALVQKVKDVEPYRLLFWNHSLTSDEIRLFGEKLAAEFPDMAFEVYLWLATVFEVTTSAFDNHELALHYYRKASSIKPSEPAPYLDACDCYDADLNIPPAAGLIEFVRSGLEHVHHPVPLYRRLAELYDIQGDTEQADHYRRKADEYSDESTDASPPAA